MTIVDVQTSAPAISAADLYETLLRGDAPFILDVRNPDDFARWRVEGRVGLPIANIPYYDFIEDPDHADDNRWVHRPPMQWDMADNRHIEGTVEHRVWHDLRHLLAVRSSLPSLDASVESEILDPVNPAVLVFQRRYQTQHQPERHIGAPAGDVARHHPCQTHHPAASEAFAQTMLGDGLG